MYLPRPLFALVRHLLPIACVDAVPYREIPNGIEIGLIRRYTNDRGTTGWTMVGGRVRYGERLPEALRRHLIETLGPDIRCALPDPHQPTRADEYFPHPRPGERRDRSKHAVALSYPVKIDGAVRAGGEALEFRWFSVNALPDESEIGFGQGETVRRIACDIAQPSTAPS